MVNLITKQNPRFLVNGMAPMFSVQRVIGEESLVETMETMRTWLDHKHYEPATFRYTFSGGGVVFRVDFSNEAAATAFAVAFQGKLLPTVTEAAV